MNIKTSVYKYNKETIKMMTIEKPFKSSLVVKDNDEFTMSEGDTVQIVLQDTGEVVEGFITKLLVKEIEIKVDDEAGIRKFSYELDVDDIKLV